MSLLGSKISLITKSENRYEGVLYTIDAKESTVALSNVRSFGTEGRRPDQEVPPSSETYDYIIFRGADIKDIHLCNSQASPSAPPNDPAIVQGGSLPPGSAPPTADNSNNNNNNNNNNNVPSNVNPGMNNGGMPNPNNNGFPNNNNNNNNNNNFGNNNGNFGRGGGRGGRNAWGNRGGHQRYNNNNNNNRQHYNRAPPSSGYDVKPSHGGVTVPAEDFDFESSNAKFAKGADDPAGAAGADGVILPKEPAYKKDAFFDNLSSDVNRDESQPRGFGRSMQQQREVDLATFGQLNDRGHHGRYGGRGGRGGRGGYGRYRNTDPKSYGRGGYNNNGGYNNGGARRGGRGGGRGGGGGGGGGANANPFGNYVSQNQ